MLALAVLRGLAGQPGLPIPPPAPDEMRVQAVLAATTLQLAPQGIPFPNPNTPTTGFRLFMPSPRFIQVPGQGSQAAGGSHAP
jgi:hypothetical protein